MPIHLVAMLEYAIEEEHIISPIDFLLRRTGMLLFDIFYAKKWSISIMKYMSEIFSWSALEFGKFERELELEIATEVI